MSSPLSTCPCCSFLSSGGLFLPWNEEGGLDENGGSNGEAENGLEELPPWTDIITPNEAWKRISARGNCVVETDEAKRPILLVDTHGHPHLQREIQYANKTDTTSSADESTASSENLVSLTCAVSPLDWENALEYASRSQKILPALGVHPWYLGDILADIDNSDDDQDIERYLKWEWLADLEAHLSEHPRALVGEIGMCKMARFVREFPKEKGGKAMALQLQKLVFRKQLELASKWSRPVTVHCVNAHGLFMEVLRNTLEEAKESCEGGLETRDAKKLWRRMFPPSIAMHSFTGTAHHVGEILAFEKELLYPEEAEAGGKRGRQRKRRQQPELPEFESRLNGESRPGSVEGNGQREMLFYFGFSHVVNHIMCTSDKACRKGMEAARSIPPNRLLVESDVHASGDVTLGTAGATAYVAQVRGETLEEIARLTSRNGLRFLNSLGSSSGGDADGFAEL